MMLKLSLITACFNEEETLERTLETIRLQQGEFELEHLIQDGSSTDGSLEIIENYRSKVNYSVIVESTEDRGFYDAINKALKKATGDVMGLLNADDWFADSGVLSDIVGAFESDDSLDAVYSNLEYVSEYPGTKKSRKRDGCVESSEWHPFHAVRRRWISSPFNLSMFKNGWAPPHPTIYVRRKLLQEVGDYRVDFGTAADYEWILRLFVKHQAKSRYLPRVSVRMLMGGQSNASLANRLIANRDDRRAWSVNGLTPYPWFRLAKPLRKLGQYF